MTGVSGGRFFVRARPDAPEKGPYTLEQLKQSLAGDLLKGTALVRGENDDAERTQTLDALLGARELERAKVIAAMNQDTAEHTENRRRRGANTRIWLGVAAIAAGGLLTYAGYSAASEGDGSGRYIVFTGLIVFGLVQVIRGAASR